MRTLVVNFKNYGDIQGEGSVRLAQAAQRVHSKTGVEIIVAPPTPLLALVASRVSIPVYSQSVGVEVGDKTTGAVIPEAVKGSGATGTILNHSESRQSLRDLKRFMPRLRQLSLEVCLCAATTAEVRQLAALGSKFLAVEPPDLIGSGVAVSKARPEVVTQSVQAARGAGFRGSVLCGAGIVSGEDVKKAVELGADGVLVSSSVVKSGDWRSKLEELADSLK
ncbi:MAG: triose-phosphate isomerase [Thaumarchaeota archaeon]|nr:triose-phosphate isomerase [Nitrososphaerota archaeon]